MRACLAGVLFFACLSVGAATGQAPATTQAPAKPDTTETWPDAAALAERRLIAEQRPLFRSAEPLAFTLVADFKAVQRDRAPESTQTYPATLRVARPDGSEASIAMQIRTRGHSRRRPSTCTFAPLRIEFAGDVTGTVFEGQRALKLGTHCRDVDEYEQYVRREYAAYRIFNLLTPRSFRTRLATASYVDAASNKPVTTRAGLFIEDDDDVARRLDGRIAEQEKALFHHVDSETITLLTLFEYMIGNTDVSMSGLHNIVLVRTPSNAIYPVPYDFDYSGLVNTRYAIPDKQFGIATVRQRLYRGPCRTADQFEVFLARMRAARAEVMAVYDAVPGLDPRYARDGKAYLDEFYRTIDRPRDVKRAFVDGCDRAGM